MANIINFLLYDGVLESILFLLIIKYFKKVKVSFLKILICSFLFGVTNLMIEKFIGFSAVSYILKLFAIMFVSFLFFMQKNAKFLKLFLLFVAYKCLITGMKLLALNFIYAIGCKLDKLQFECIRLFFAIVISVILIIENLNIKKKQCGLSLSKCKINFTISNNKFTVKAFNDSGNLLVDTKTNRPVIVVSESVFKKNNFKTFLLQEKKQFTYLKYSTIGGYCSEMLVFYPDEMELIYDNKIENIVNKYAVGVVASNFKHFDAIFNCCYL